MKKPGRLYVFEGPDGVGKTTLSKWFARNLQSQDDGPVVWSSFPGSEKGSVGNLVYRLHHKAAGLRVKTIHPLSLQLFHVAAHIDAIESRFQKQIQDGATIVLDRFWWSTWVYGRFAGGDAAILNAMIDVEKRVWRNLKPARVFLITRHAARSSQARKHLEQLYVQLARKEAHSGPVTRVQSDGTLIEAQNQILSSLL